MNNFSCNLYLFVVCQTVKLRSEQIVSADANLRQYERPNGTSSMPLKKKEAKSPSSRSSTDVTAGLPSYLFAEKLVPLLVDLFLKAPSVEKYIIYPEIIQSFGR